MSFSPSQVLNNRYRIVKKLGEGGFGAVYRAWDLNLDALCALKKSFDTSPAAQGKFQGEAQILYQLSHANLPKLIDFFVVGGVTPCLVMEFVEGEGLMAKLQREGGSLPERMWYCGCVRSARRLLGWDSI